LSRFSCCSVKVLQVNSRNSGHLLGWRRALHCMSPVAPKYWGKPLGPHKVGAYGGWLACVIVYVGDVFTDYE